MNPEQSHMKRSIAHLLPSPGGEGKQGSCPPRQGKKKRCHSMRAFPDRVPGLAGLT
jgi:hypothetical protein